MSEYRERSRSPTHTAASKSQLHRHSRIRSRSPIHRSRSHKHRSHHSISANNKPLPLLANPLSKHDLSTHRPLFALYLDIQKQIDIEDVAEDEVKGRWKSFVKKWNNGDLAEGWYDTKTFDKAVKGTFGTLENGSAPKTTVPKSERSVATRKERRDEEDDEDDFGPELPTTLARTSEHSQSNKAGPSIPSTSELRARTEQTLEDEVAQREKRINDLRAERRADRKLQSARLDELAPRAEAGTRERQLEKKREVAVSHRTFAAAKDAGDVELRDADVMGEEDSLGELRRRKEMEERKKTERELRREEILRARTAEREERLKGMREKEDKTMEMLKSIARARFGGEDGG